MSRMASSWIGLGALALAACAVDAAPPGAAPATPPETTGAQAPSAADSTSEEARVQDFLSRLYRPESVVHSFASVEGKAIDCVDFQAERGVQAMLAEGYSLDQIRQFGELTPEQKEYNKTARPAPTAFAGDLDPQGNARACPDGSVAHERLTKERIAASGGLDAFRNLSPQKALPPPVAPSACAYPDIDHYQWTKAGWPATSNQGGSAVLSIARPTMTPGMGDHSLSQTWLVGTSGCVTQTVEAGWTVDEILNGDLSPHVFIYATASTYGVAGGGTGPTGCYNDNLASPNCVPYVPITSIASIPALTASVPGGAQHEIAFSTTHVGTLQCRQYPPGYFRCSETYTGWQIAMQIDSGAWQTLGYYQNSAYGTGPLASAATQYEAGSEVYNTVANANVVYGNPNVTMGEQILTTPMLQTSLYGGYSYIRNYSIVGSDGTPAAAPDAYVGVGETHQTCEAFGTCTYNYTTANFGTPGASSWSNWYWYGDNQNLIW
jgi:hypothetical protein